MEKQDAEIVLNTVSIAIENLKIQVAALELARDTLANDVAESCRRDGRRQRP